MLRLPLFSFLLCLFFLQNGFAETTTIWSGEVNSNGTPTRNVKLELGKRYQIQVSGIVNLGKWWQQGKPFANDACYEFNPQVEKPKKFASLKNSLNIAMEDSAFHSDHLYQSVPFVAAQSGIHFWVYDTDYSDNSGSFHVKINQMKAEDSPVDSSQSVPDKL